MFFTYYYLGDQIKDNEIGGACRAHGEIINLKKKLVAKIKGKNSTRNNVGIYSFLNFPVVPIWNIGPLSGFL
jgi:hypothetical protein